jgi:hypothetical protein
MIYTCMNGNLKLMLKNGLAGDWNQRLRSISCKSSEPAALAAGDNDEMINKFHSVSMSNK